MCPSCEHFPLTPCFVHRVDTKSLYLERGLYSVLFSVHSSTDYKRTEPMYCIAACVFLQIGKMKDRFTDMAMGRGGSQSIQCARLSLQSSESGLPHPLTRKRVVPPPSVLGGGGTLACGREGGRSQFGRRNRHYGTLGIV